MALCRPNPFLVDTRSMTFIFVCLLLQRHVTRTEEYDPNEQPQNLTVVQASYTFLLITWTPPLVNASDVDSYSVKWHIFDPHPGYGEGNKTLTPDTLQYYIRGLTPGTRYGFYVVANHKNGKLSNSLTVTHTTEGYGKNRPCTCDPWGSIEPVTCDNRTGQCQCKNKYTTGQRCDSCHSGYFAHEHKGCEPCNCPNKLSDGSCRVDENGVLFCNCRSGRTGILCNLCENGLYMLRGKCAPCKCNDNANMSSPDICDDMSGTCSACINNTIGDHCESCLPGYQGDAIYHNCTKSEVPTSSHTTIVTIATCFAVIIVIVLILVTFTLMKCRRPNDKHSPFWTVQLRDDHENVNFSALTEQPECHVADASLVNNDHVEFANRNSTLEFKSHGACA